MGGDKVWEYVIVPKTPGDHTIPSLSFSFFNAELGKYETLQTRPLNLHVIRGTDSAASIALLPGSDKQNLVRRGSDIHFIKLSAGDLDKQKKPFYESLWFYLIAGIPVVFNAGVLLYQRKRCGRQEEAAFLRMRRARRRALNRLKAAEKKGGTNARYFYDEAAAALSGYLTERFGLTEIELTGDRLEQALSEKSVPQQVLEETRACLQECDFGRFVSASASADGIQTLLTRIRKNIDALESLRKESGSAHVMLLFSALFLSAWNLQAAASMDAGGLFDKANSEYQAGNFASAERLYLQVLNLGYDSGTLYYNLGNACFKQKRLGDAVYYWEKARERLPADREIRENLELANLLIVDRIEAPDDPLPMRALSGISGFLAIPRAAGLVLSLFVAANILFSLYLLLKNPRSAYRALLGCIGIGALFAVFACSLAWRIYQHDFQKKGIVVAQKIDVRSGPGNENIAVFTLHEGTKVRVHESSRGWYQISLPNGWSGWLQQSALRVF